MPHGLPMNKKRYFPLLLFSVYCLILLCIYIGYHLKGLYLLGGDGVMLGTDYIFKQNVLSSGELPLWNKFLAGGIPLTDSITPLLLLTFLPLQGYVYVLYIGLLALGATYLYLYLAEIKCSMFAAACISTCYLLSVHLGGMRKSHFSIILTIVMFPIIMYYIERYFSVRKLRFLLVSSVCMALQFYIGFLQYIVYGDIYLFIYLLAYGFHYRMNLKTMLLHGAAWGFSYLGLISFRLIPMLYQQSYYALSGSAGTDYNTFLSFSIHPMKIIMMIFPKFFGESGYIQPLGAFSSSEFDIEIFLGFPIFILLIIGIWTGIKEFRVRFSLCTMVVTFLYASMGANPVIAKVVYQLPYLGDFRCASRILYLFIFSSFIISAICLTKFENIELSKKATQYFSIPSIVLFLFMAGALLIVLMGTFIVNGLDSDAYNRVKSYIRQFYAQDLCYICVFVLAVVTLYYIAKKRRSVWKAGISGIVAVLTILQTVPYSSETPYVSIAAVQPSDPTGQAIAQEIGEYKVWSAIDSNSLRQENTFLAYNAASTYETNSLNAYISFNNPDLYSMLTLGAVAPANASQLLSGSPCLDMNLKFQNSLLSMLGVKYIIDTSDRIVNDNVFIEFENSSVCYEDEIIKFPDSNGELALLAEPIQIEPRTYYKVSFEYDVTQPEVWIFDFWGDGGYDFPEQDAYMTLSPEGNHCTFMLYSGDSDLYTNHIWRIQSYSDVGYEIRNFKIEKMNISYTGSYTQWNPDINPKVYINHNARDILYIPDAIQHIENDEQIYTNNIELDLDTVNYMEEQPSRTLTPQSTILSNVKFHYNYITADIMTEEDTFVNFSECYYPGWTAYVDNVETEIYKVNGVIMGMEVPKGTHTIQFSYEPKDLKIGAFMTIATAFIMIAPCGVLWVKRKRDHIDKLTEHIDKGE